MKLSQRRRVYLEAGVWLLLLTILGCGDPAEDGPAEEGPARDNHGPTFSVDEPKDAGLNPAEAITGGQWEGITTTPGKLWKRVRFEVDSENRRVMKVKCQWRSLSDEKETYKGTITWPAKDGAPPADIRPDGSFEFRVGRKVFTGRFGSADYAFGTSPGLGAYPVGVSPEDDRPEWRAAPVKSP